MKNLLCRILFCITTLCLVNADCPTYTGVNNATFNKEGQCGDITIRCDKGFTMEAVTECIDGEWKYQEPFCKPPECGYKFTNKTFIPFSVINGFPDQNEIKCDKLCDDESACSTTFLDEDDYCSLYPAPLIFASKVTDLDQCIAKCTQMEECLMLHYYKSTQECTLCNVTLDHFSDVISEGRDYDIIAEKCCL